MKPGPDPIDRHVGGRVRMHRMLAGFSQVKLADALGITFQQIKKYEKGSNRISASRLQQIANMVGVPVSFFFEDASTGQNQPPALSDAASTDPLTDFLATSEGVQLTKAFVRVKSASARRRIIELAEAVAEDG
ncbi:helix-turn-helix domain-containing protein [Bosea sp. PAMC 26642]|uniref:helix-turn-helix domain-containing protein n=1 Tax=Bosea sp. (strain PAMC 26642) TaxID=1792307 RepID=UPI0007704F10|nr:helix-turn-helix domain-containing protein [Bosea sp. PAMC 26642]AMJ62453.1 Cro/Cl family transcriptional regulator [Bosea sp. PAMC 26642]